MSTADPSAEAYAGSSDPAAVASRAAALGGETIGRSRRGRALVAITIGDAGPVTLVLAGIHPMEWIGVEAALAIAEHARANVLPDRRVVVVPVINVDGHAAVASDVASGRRRYRRGNAARVDLNRNFGTAHVDAPRWWPLVGPGPSALSEPETAAVAALAERLPIDRAIALHSFGRMILLPWAHRGERAPGWDALVADARAIASRLREAGGGRYRVLHTGRWPLFRPGGLELDWLTSRGARTMLVECGGGGLALTRPSTWSRPFAWYNPADPRPHARALVAALWPFIAES